MEIQLFQKGTDINTAKVLGFVQSVTTYFADKNNKPEINIQTQEDIATYGVLICYKAPDGQPIILIGSSNGNGMAENIEQCTNQENTEEVRAYHFEPAATRAAPNIQKYKATMEQLRHGAEKQDQQEQEQQACCTGCVIQ